MNIDFKKFNKKTELDRQRELFKECFSETIGTSRITEEHYLWKFHEKEKGKSSSEYGAYIKDELIGYYAAIPYVYKTEKGTLKAAMVCDVMTGIKARGRGVFTKLGIYSTDELAKEGYDITTGYPIRKEVIPGHIKAGWEKNIELPLYGRFIKFNSFLKKKKIGFIAPLLNVLMLIYSNLLIIFFTPKDKSLKVDFYNANDLESISGLSEFYGTWGTQVNISLIKDMNFLKWRLGAPETEYYIVVLRDGEKIAGVLISRKVIREGVPCLGILDLAILKEYYKHSKFLFKGALRIAKENNLEMLLIMISKFWYNNYKLFFNSFIKTPFKFYLIVKKLNKKLDEKFIKKENNWHVMWLDSDDL